MKKVYKLCMNDFSEWKEVSMKKYKAILFDMDGTLLPMDNDAFTKGYFKYLCGKLASYGIPADKLVASVWDGTKTMIRNDGKQKNEEVFWKRFYEITGLSEDTGIREDCDSFYTNEFNLAKNLTGENLLAIEAVKAARQVAPIVALATNPLFPMAGQKTRMGWIGLNEKDFDLVTSYETDSYCKPNPSYFTSVCERLGVNPAECLMIGNDEEEDMFAAVKAGITDCYLVTDTMIPSKNRAWEGPKGSFAEMVEMLKQLRN